MNKKRLLKLADFLETVPRRKFNLRMWIQSLPSKPEAKTAGHCGFAGCAIGWAAHAKLFRGLHLNRADWTPVYHGAEDWDAPMVLFDLEAEQTKFLFSVWHYDNERTTPKQVAKRIRKFVEADGVFVEADGAS